MIRALLFDHHVMIEMDDAGLDELRQFVDYASRDVPKHVKAILPLGSWASEERFGDKATELHLSKLRKKESP